MQQEVDPNLAARTYWCERGRTPGPAAVLPAGRWLGYHAWTTRLLHAWTRSRLDRPRFRRFVDLGCGRGDWTATFADRVDEIHACDVSPELAAETRVRLAATGHSRWNVQCRDLQSFAIPRGADLIYIGAVLSYFDDPGARRVLERVCDASVPGGLVIVRDYCAFNLGRRSIQAGSGFSIHRRARDIVELAREAGLRVLEVRSSPSIYAEQLGNAVTRWPLLAAWRLATAGWTRASHTFVLRA
jgi:SAM-dependent methyltransferase